MATETESNLAQGLRVVARPSPFRTDLEDFMVSEGWTIREILDGLGVRYASVLINDAVIPEKFWHVTRPRSGATLYIRALPGDDGALRTILTIGVIALGGWVGGLAVGASGVAAKSLAANLISAGATAATTAVGMALVNQIAPPPDTSASVERNAQASITGTQNRANKYGPVPKIYGMHKVYPVYAAQPYTEIVGDDVYFRALFCVGYGQLRVSSLKIGTTAFVDNTDVGDFAAGDAEDAGNFSDWEVQIRDLAAGDSLPDLFTSTVSTTSLSTTLEEDGTWYTQTTETDTDEITVDLTFTGGLTTSDRSAVQVEFQVQTSPTGAGTWTNATIIPIGPGATTPQTGTLLVKQKRYGLFRRGFRVVFASQGQYDVRIQRVDSRKIATTGTAYCDASEDSWNIAGTINLNDFCYRPMAQLADEDRVDDVQWTALRSITRTPPVDTSLFDQGVYIALRIRASDQLNGTIDQLSCVAEAKLSVYNGSTWSAPQITRSPAWAYADVLTGNGNKRALATSRLDGAALLAWANNCTSDGRSFDYVLSDRGTVFDRLRLIAASARAAYAQKDGLFTVVEDRARSTVVQHFTPRNSWNFGAQKAFVDQPHGLKIQFVNADEDYQQDERIVYDDGYTSANATKFEQLTLPGITDSDIAWKDGRYHIACSRLRPEVYTLNADIENIVCTRGDLVRVSHDVPLWGLYWGRIKTVTTDGGGDVTELTTDEDITMVSGTAYGIRIRLSDGTSVTATPDTVAGTGTTITFSTPIPAASAPAGGELFQFGESGSESVPLIVKEIIPLSDLAATIVMIDYNAAVYTSDTGTIPAYSSNITVPPERNPNPPPTPVITALKSDETVLAVNGDGTLRSQIRVSFSVPEDATKPLSDEFHVEFRSNDPQTEWQRIPLVNGSARVAYVAPVDDGEAYDIRVRSSTRFGVVSEWDTETNHTVVGKTSPPPDVTSFTVQQNGDVVVFKWSQVVIADLSGYEIRYGVQNASTWDAATTATKATKGTAITDASVPPGDWTFFVKAVDTSGNFSTNAKSFNATVISTYDQIVFRDQSVLGWPGMKDGFIVHPVSNVLVPKSQTLASGLDWEVFDTFVPDPVPTSTYIVPEMDSSFDDTVRIWGDISFGYGPGESGGVLDYRFEIASRLTGGTYSGADTTDDWGLITDAVTDSNDWGLITEAVDPETIEDWGFVPNTDPWSIGSRDTRYVYQLYQYDNTEGEVYYVDHIDAYVDLVERTEKASDVVIGASGTTVVFDREFHLTPVVKAIADSATALFVTKENVTTTGCTFHVFNSSGTEVGGTIDYEVTGV